MENTFEERQRIENERQYRQWLSCGFSGEMEVNDSGWCTNGISFYKDERLQKWVLFDKPYFRASIEYLQFPNGKWAAGSSATFPLHGWGHGVSVWSKQYNTRQEAIFEQIDYIEHSLYDGKDKKKFVMDALQCCRNKFKETDVEMAFEPTAQFEQVSLF